MEWVAEMEDRLDHSTPGMVPDWFEYRLARARLRAANGSANEAVVLFQTMLADQTVLRPRDDVYGLALAFRRARDFDAAWKTLAPLRTGSSHPAFDLLARELQPDMRRA